MKLWILDVLISFVNWVKNHVKITLYVGITIVLIGLVLFIISGINRSTLLTFVSLTIMVFGALLAVFAGWYDEENT